MIELENLQVKYKGFEVLNIDEKVHFDSGAIIGVVGSNSCPI